MRTLLCSTLLLALLTNGALCQRMRFQNGGGRQRFPFPSGPLNSGSGASSQINSPTPVGSRGCFCLPVNQLCNPSGPVPVGASRISNVGTRILNIAPLDNCPEGQIECCFGSLGGDVPHPIPPVSQPITGCGARQSLIPGNARAAEADFGEYPWMTAIVGPNSKFVAAGTLVAPNWVLTAAHKVVQPETLRVRAGDYNLAVPNEVPEFPHQEVSVNQVILHPNFNPTNLKNDVALLRLHSPIKIDRHINVVCLPERFQVFSGQRCHVSGWGENVDSSFQPILREVDLPIIDGFECEESLRRTRLGANFTLDQESFLCAGGETGKDACRGDGGAPLVCDERGVFTVVGLVAWGIGCGRNNIPGVYVNIATFSDFINSHIHS